MKIDLTINTLEIATLEKALEQYINNEIEKDESDEVEILTAETILNDIRVSVEIGLEQTSDTIEQ